MVAKWELNGGKMITKWWPHGMQIVAKCYVNCS